MDCAVVRRVAMAGGQMIVLPHADPDVVCKAKVLNMIAMPGFATPTEAFKMIAAGADALKLFPAEAFTPAMLRGLRAVLPPEMPVLPVGRSEEHTSELQSLMRISYAVFCLQQKNTHTQSP